jgi:hypothetical protein
MVTPVIDPPVMLTLLEFCKAIDPSPNASRAPDAEVAPVPPLASGIGLPDQIDPVPMVLLESVCESEVPTSAPDGAVSDAPHAVPEETAMPAAGYPISVSADIAAHWKEVPFHCR